MQRNKFLQFLIVLVSSTLFCDVASGGDLLLCPKPAPPEIQCPPCACPISLQKTLELSYMGSTDLDATRAGLRATDEDVAIAFSDWRPSLSATGQQQNNVSYYSYPVPILGEPVDTVRVSTTSYEAKLSQNVYKGGATVAGIGQAESNVSSGKAGLFVQEQKTLFTGVQVHTDIVAKEQIVKFQENNKKFLGTLLAETQAKFEVGEGSRTDVEVALGQYEKGVADLTLAIGNLESAKALYLQLTGVKPGALCEGIIMLNVPDTYEEALCVAKSRNPTITQAYYALKAAEYYVDLQFSKLLPNLDVSSTIGSRRDSGTNYVQGYQKEMDVRFLTELYVPIYLQGKPSAEVRQAYQKVAQAKVNLVGAQRQVTADTRTAWENLLVARENVRSVLAQVKALELSVEGAVEEANVGLKSVIDITIQQQKLVDSQIRLADVQKDLVNANYQVLQAMGRLTACDLRLKVKYYDPDTYYDEYQNAWIQFWEGEDMRYVKDGDTK